jgi:hypothetical protein
MPGAAGSPSAQPSAVAALYETLRRTALGDPLPPRARSGLTIFLRRGMWRWAQTMIAANTRQEAVSLPSIFSAQPCEQIAVVHVLADMAMNTAYRRAP